MECAPFPEGAEYLWAAFLRLHSCRGATMAGPARLTWPEFDAFNRMTAANLTPEDAEIIEALDGVYMRSLAKK